MKVLRIFFKYFSVGVLNTIIHWVVFSTLVYYFYLSQAIANFIGFIVAVTFSFFANATFTFKATVSTLGYTLYVGFMGVLSLLTGAASDCIGLNPIFTLIIFSLISLICGFFYSKNIVFKGDK